jgi:hypothetical protein
VEIVADAGAVVGWVVVAEHLEGRVFHAADGHVGEEWEEVARSSFWFLADETRGVCAGWAVGKEKYAGSVTRGSRAAGTTTGAYLKYRSEMHFQCWGLLLGALGDVFGRAPTGRVRTAAVVVEDRLGHDF